MYVCMYVCMYVYVYVCMYVYMYGWLVDTCTGVWTEAPVRIYALTNDKVNQPVEYLGLPQTLQ